MLKNNNQLKSLPSQFEKVTVNFKILLSDRSPFKTGINYYTLEFEEGQKENIAYFEILIDLYTFTITRQKIFNFS